MAEAKYKRRKILVDPELQIGVSTYIVGWIYVYFLGFALLANLPALLDLATSESGEGAAIAAFDRIRAFAQFVVLPMGLTFVAMAVHGVWITHRVAGPIVRIKRTVRELAARKVPGPIGLRTKDYFQDLAQEINAALATMREDVVRRRRLSQANAAAARRLVETLERGGDAREALALASEVLDGAEALDKHLAATVDGAPAPQDGPAPVPLAEAELPAPAAEPAEEAAA